MANQPKNYKKFVATAATATLVASAIVPVASAASFSDIEGNTHADAIKALSDAGIIKGYEDGTFKPNAEINRGQTVKLLGRWLETKGYKVPEDWNTKQRFNDLPVNAADQELVKYAALVKDAGVFNGSNGNLNYSQPMQRQQMAVVLVRAIKTIEGIDLIQDYKAAGFQSSIKDLDKAYSTENVEAITALEYAGITVVENFNPTSAITRGQFASFLNRTINYEAPVQEAKVVSVNAINAKQVEVNFNTAIDADTVIDSTNGYVLKNISFDRTTTDSDPVDYTKATGKLSEDGKKLTITLDTGETFEGTYAITINSNVKTKAGEKIKDYAGTFSIKDQVAPQIVKVSATTNTNVATSVKITFSEPVSTAVVKINGKVYTPSGVGTEEFTVSGLALEVGKNHTLEVLNATDAKNNINALQSTTFQVNKDTVAPTVSYQAVGDHKILLTFSKDMDVTSVNTNSVKVVEEDLTSLTAPTDYTVTQKGNSKREFYVNINKALYGTKSERTLTVQVNDLAKDSLGNKAVVTTQNVKLTKDTEAPTVSNVTVINDSQGNAEKLRIQFNEELKAAPTDLSKVTAKNATEGTTVTVTDILDQATIKLLDDNKTIEVGVKSDALGKKFNLAFAKGFVQDTAQTANDSVAFSRTVEFKSASSAFKIAQADIDTTTPNTIKIVFDRTVVGDFGANAANNPANYTVAGQALPADTDITISTTNTTRDTVTIVLPDEFVEKTDTNAVFTVNNVKGTDGATITPFVGYVSVKDNITPKLEKVSWNPNGSFTLTFSEAVVLETGKANGVEATVEIKLNDGTYTLATSNYSFAEGNGVDDGKIVVTLVKKSDATYGDYIDINGDNDYDPGIDVLVADIVNVTVKTLDKDATYNKIQDKDGNAAKVDLTVSASK